MSLMPTSADFEERAAEPVLLQALTMPRQQPRIRRVSNILALPLAHLTIYTANNEDWVDVIQYITADEKQVDLRGIDFDMEVRRRPQAYEVVLRASSQENRWISIGAGANYGFLVIYVPEITMRGLFAGQYVGDIRARDERFKRVCATFDLTIIEGITKSKRRWVQGELRWV